MALYSYVARSRSGERIEGSIEATDRRGALQQIEQQGHVPVSVKEGGALIGTKKSKPAKKKKPDSPPKGSAPRRSGRRARMKLREVLLFSQEMSDLLASGMTLGIALNTLANRETGRGQDEIVAELRDEIIRGTSFSDALEKRPETFPGLYVSMVRAGEASGTLPQTLVRLCTHYERLHDAREKVAMALIYPCIVLAAGGLVLIFSMVFVVPKFAQIFEDLGSTMPLPTLILINTSHFMLKYGWLLLGLAFGAYILLRRYFRTPSGKRWFGAFQLRMPLVKGILTASAFSQFARTLGGLLENGVQVLEALAIVENTVGNVVIEDEIREARSRVTDGATISAPLAAGKKFPRMLTDMLAVSEESGDMAGALNHIAQRYESELDRNIKIFTTMLEPILLLVVAALIGFVAISMLLAVFDLTSGLGV